MEKIHSQKNIIPQLPHEYYGIYAERYVATITNTLISWHFSNVAFDVGSDIETLKISVKSARFTLASHLLGETKEEKINDFFNRVHSTRFAYVTRNGDIYIMNATEFQQFVTMFASLQKASKKNGGQMVVRAKSETKKMLQWFEGQI